MKNQSQNNLSTEDAINERVKDIFRMNQATGGASGGAAGSGRITSELERALIAEQAL